MWSRGGAERIIGEEEMKGKSKFRGVLRKRKSTDNDQLGVGWGHNIFPRGEWSQIICFGVTL